MMRRIDEAFLDLRDDKWYLERWDKKTEHFIETNILFTGLILFENEGAINEVPYKNKLKICKDGVLVGDYKIHPYISKIVDSKAKKLITSMHGKYRFPTLLKEVDSLARGKVFNV